MRRVSAVTLSLALCFALVGCNDDNVNPDKNTHARMCLTSGSHIKTHDQTEWGGKWSVTLTTYWCENSDLQITDIWFEN